MRVCLSPKVDNIVLIKQYRVGHEFNKIPTIGIRAVDEKSARRPKYHSRDKWYRVRNERCVAEIKSEDSGGQLCDTR